MWGLAYEGWQPNAEEEGVSVFIQGYENRGPNNERKRIYASATTPDLISTRYRDKFTRFFEELFAIANTGKPLMKQFYESYFDLYWDLHLGVRGEAIPPAVRQFGSSFNAVLGFVFPTSEVVRDLGQPPVQKLDNDAQRRSCGKRVKPNGDFGPNRTPISAQSER